MKNFCDFSAKSIDGTDVSFKQYAGKVLLLVNVASECGLTPQYKRLEFLHGKYEEQGFRVLGFPCNQFAGQEPGSEEEILSFCQANYGVTFPLFSKIEVNGDGRHPLYTWLTDQEVGPEPAGDVKWNFGKFLIGRDGLLAARFEPQTHPMDKALIQAVEAALKQEPPG